MTSHLRVRRVLWLVVFLISAPVGQAYAQRPGREPRVGYRGFFEAAPQEFTAADTFNAVLGSRSGVFLGGGGQVRWNDLLLEVSASRFKDTGERVFISGGEVFRLGIPTTITVRPIEFTAAYRLPRLWRFRPYAGAGLGTQRYTETAKFNISGEDVKQTDRSYHAAAGTEFRVWRWIATAAEVRYRSVADAIGKSGVSKEYGEDNLGGTSISVRVIVVGR